MRTGLIGDCALLTSNDALRQILRELNPETLVKNHRLSEEDKVIRQLVRQCWFEERGIFLQHLKKVVSRDGKRKAQWFSGYAGRFFKSLSVQAEAIFLQKICCHF